MFEQKYFYKNLCTSRAEPKSNYQLNPNALIRSLITPTSFYFQCPKRRTITSPTDGKQMVY